MDYRLKFILLFEIVVLHVLVAFMSAAFYL